MAGKRATYGTPGDTDPIIAAAAVERLRCDVSFCTKNVEGRIDDPDIGWGRGFRTTTETCAPAAFQLFEMYDEKWRERRGSNPRPPA
jgi:hypothetical protein